MVLIAITFLFISFCGFAFGLWLQKSLKSIFREHLSLPAELLSFLGLIVIGVIANVISLFHPVNDEALVLVAGLALYFTLKNRHLVVNELVEVWRRVLRTKILEWGFVLILAGICISKASVLSTVHDEGVYYIQTIKWNQQFGLVPGLGNLEGRFGFNSSWHIVMALFGFEGLSNLPNKPTFNDIGELSALLIGLWMLHGASLWQRGEKSNFNGYRLGMLMAWPIIVVHDLSSPMADLGVMLSIWVAIGLLINYFEENKKESLSTLIVLIACFAITVKLSAIIMALVGLFFFRRALSKGKPLQAISVAALCLVVLFPWAYRTFVITGYWLYPVKGTDWLVADWKIPENEVAQEAFEVTRFARFGPDGPKGLVPNGWYEQVQPAFVDWFPYWFNKTLSLTEQIFYVLSLFSAIALTIVLILNFKKLNTKDSSLIWIGFLTLVGAVFWFIKGPSFRFGYGYLIPLVVITTLLVWKSLQDLSLTVSTLFIGVNFLAFGIQGIDTRSVKRYYMFPASYPKVPVSTKMIGTLEVNLPAGYFDHDETIKPCSPPECVQCWDASLPCTFEIQKGLIRRGPELKDGFRIDKDWAEVQQ